MNDQTRSEVPATALDGVIQALGGSSDMEPEPLEFKSFKSSIFEAEVGQDGEDFIFHFYMPTVEDFWEKMGIQKNQRSKVFAEQFWEELFPLALDAVARSYFQAEFPRLTAMHMVQVDCSVEFDGQMRPLNSWWMRAKGFVHNTLDPDAFVEKFYRLIEEALVNRNRT